MTAPPDVATVQQRRQHRSALSITLAVVALAILAMIAWLFLLPTSTGEMPGGLPEAVKKEIAALSRKWTVRSGFQALLRGEFRECIRRLKISRQQRINRFVDHRDGTFTVYTVVDSPKDTDGWYAWSRHIMIKTNGEWVILRSY